MDDGFQEVQTTLEIDLHPSKLRDVEGSVREQLDKMLLMYRPELNGVLLCYRNATILSKAASVHAFFPYVRVNAAASLILLTVRMDQHLIGKVSRVGQDFVGVLVLGVVNAAIYKEDLQGRFQYDAQGDTWVSKSGAHEKLSKDVMIRFQVLRVDVQDSAFIVRGSLAQEQCGVLMHPSGTDPSTAVAHQAVSVAANDGQNGRGKLVTSASGTEGTGTDASGLGRSEKQGRKNKGHPGKLGQQSDTLWAESRSCEATGLVDCTRPYAVRQQRSGSPAQVAGNGGDEKQKDSHEDAVEIGPNVQRVKGSKKGTKKRKKRHNQ